ncbi:MAG: Rid family detoxifying hydrolase, partial [Victivallales bacterium]|nr:Rid family detoxifying hydrolase [Victivallales bacterium]
AVEANGFIFCSGQLALDADTGGIIDSDIEAETARVMDNLSAVLIAAGSSLDKVVKTTIFVRDMNDFASVNKVYGSYFTNAVPPARATIQVAVLPKD